MMTEKLDKISLLDFDSRIEKMITEASAMVGMGGYNTFCEILSFDKKAIIVPRTRPRQEQLIRARRAEELGVVTMIMPDDANEPANMARSLAALTDRRKPSEAGCLLPLDGLNRIGSIVEHHLNRTNWPELRVLTSGV